MTLPPLEEATEPVVLGDHAARDRVRRDLDETLFVEAGAGTGKTSVLVARIVALIDSGRAELGEIAAISFTEAAAAELRERVRLALRDAEPSLTASIARRRAAAVDQVDEAALTTIHGFAHRVLSEHPLQAGLPLRLEVLDEIGASLAIERRFSSFLDALYDDPRARDLVAAAELLRISADSLRSLYWQMDERRGPKASSNATAGGATSSDGEDGLDLVDAIAPTVERFVGSVAASAAAAVATRAACLDDEDLLCQRLGEIDAELGGLRPGADWLDQLGWLIELRERRVGNVGRQQSWGEPGVDEVRDAVRSYDEARVGATRAIAEALMAAIGSRLRADVEDFADERRRAGTLLFHDLLVLSQSLVATSDEVRRELQRRYRYILVDEFQDTDPLQVDLVVTLGSDLDSGSVVPGRLFFVGDPMQSIYRFRGADLASYLETRARLGSEEPVRLTTNFRSVPGVLDFVNEVFGRLTGGSIGTEPAGTEPGGAASGDAASLGAASLGAASFDAASFGSGSVGAGPLLLEAARAELSDAPPVVLLGEGDAELSARSRRERESVDIATIIAEAVETSWPVEDDGVIRPARYGDVAVLVPTRSGLGELESSLEAAGIEFRFGESSLVYGSNEVRDILAVLRAVQDRGDDRDVIGALRTPAFGCSDRDLVEHRVAGGSWRLGDRAAAGSGAVAAGIGELTELSELARRLGVTEILEAIVEQRKLRQLLAAGRHPAEALRRLEFVLERARGFVDAGGTSIGELLAFMEQESSVGLRRADATLALAEPDAVRVLTIHGAKGLEFPIVVLAELGGSPRPGTRGPTVLRAPDGRLELSISRGLETSGFAALRDSEADEARREALRLCYVAATRARDHLVVSLHHRPVSYGERSLAELLSRACPDGLATGPSIPSPGAPLQGRFVLGAPASINEAGYHRFLESRRALLERISAPTSVVATALESAVARGGPRPGRDDPVPADGARSEDDDGGIAWRRGRAASKVGRAVHAVLQRIDLGSGADLDGLARRASVDERCEESAEVVADLVRAALSSPVIREAAASSTLVREVPVALPIPGGVLEGVVDLLFSSEVGLVGVDYKTDALASPAEVALRAERYRLQVGAYAYALGELCGAPMARFVLVFLAPPTGAIEYEFDDLALAADDALSAAVARLWRPSEPVA